MAERALDFGALPKEERTGARSRHLLALTGGGYRGIFTAQILSRMEAAAGHRLATRFDLIGGTSIGGILAIGIGYGIPANDIVEQMRAYGPAIFTPTRLSFGGTASSHYDPAALREAVVKILGKPNAQAPFADIPARLAVVAVDERSSKQKIFKTRALAGDESDRLATIDVAMATSAAPTYFPPHQVDDHMFVDGGLIANAPDLILIGEAMRSLGARLDDVHLCSIGTASNPRVGRVAGEPGKVQWVMQHALIELIMDAQVALALEQVKRLSPGSILRIDRRPSRHIGLDDVSDRARDELLALADQAVDEVFASREWRRIIAHDAAC
jgi:patatin-like phospholipase/acyl hydrolase